MKVAVIGSRGIKELDLEKYLPEDTCEIISGGAKGVDSLAEAYALRHHIAVKKYLPDYSRYGRAAPLVRNREIVESCDVLLAFWDGMSTGTAYTVKYAKSKEKLVKLFQLK